MNLVILTRGRQENLPDYQKGKKVIEDNIETFVSMVAVTKQKAVPSIEFSTPKENLEREQEVKDAMLDLLQLLTEGLKERDASSSTPTARVTPGMKLSENNLLVSNFPWVSPMQGEILWQKIPRPRKVSSVSRGNRIVFTHYPKDSNCEVCMNIITTRGR